MDARLTLKPGRPGTKKLMKTYGDRLVCVRYRYDQEQRKRIKTVELIVDETDWDPFGNIPDEALVGVRVEMKEKALQKRVKSAGGKWVPKERLWHIRFVDVDRLGLRDRIEKRVRG